MYISWLGAVNLDTFTDTKVLKLYIDIKHSACQLCIEQEMNKSQRGGLCYLDGTLWSIDFSQALGDGRLYPQEVRGHVHCPSLPPFSALWCSIDDRYWKSGRKPLTKRGRGASNKYLIRGAATTRDIEKMGVLQNLTLKIVILLSRV